MKKLGYRRRFAGAVEAAASTGGMLMPPVMGAGAFVMAEITGISYINIVIAAMLGSILLYASMVIRVHYTACGNTCQASVPRIWSRSYRLQKILTC